jgi:hypothetical protein
MNQDLSMLNKKTINPKCSLCSNVSVDSFETEAGNNAEIPVTVNLCEEHWTDYEKDEDGFMDRNAEKFDEMAYDQMIDHADMLKDDGL